jgi:hypothetical protein
MAILGVVVPSPARRLRGVVLITVGALGGALLGDDAAAPERVADRVVERVEVPPPRLETLATFPAAIHGVTVSPYSADDIAVWTDRDILASRDGGRAFERVLRGDGVVSDVAFRPDGSLVALRGDRWIGVRDAGHERESWDLVGPFRPRDADDDALWGPRPRLVVQGGALAVVGADATEPTRLLIAWRTASGRWRDEILFHDRSERWDTAEVLGVDVAMPGEIQVVVQTWQAGDCGGWERHHRVVFDARTRTARAAWLDEYPDPAPRPDEEIIERAALRRDGRWIGLDPADARRLVRSRL